jgi:hypothetical protein
VIESGQIAEAAFERDGCDGPRSVAWIRQHAMGAGEPLAKDESGECGAFGLEQHLNVAR